ncbi:MAG: LapA family protein [Deltaproteobacteria bacterium]|nr:MAG: LapA family protein [Deltaproteobacteria bacterium]
MMIRNITFVILVAIVLTFVIQNMQVVEVRFLAWTISMSRALMIFGTLVIGIAAGWLLKYPKRRRELK